jgi:hypothetical protein
MEGKALNILDADKLTEQILDPVTPELLSIIALN